MNEQLGNQTSSNNWLPPPDLSTGSPDLLFLPGQGRGSWLGSSTSKDEKSPVFFGDVDTKFQDTLDILKRKFIFKHADAVEAFLRSHRGSSSVLLEAAPYMAQAFGEQTPLALEIMQEDDSPRTIYALAMWRGERAKAREARTNFDESWLMPNLKKAAGRIVFDYELI